jgi:pimeloyl-ACP methyl ester carboxylesterase
VTTFVRDGLELRYEVLGGSGPALLLPQLNFSWPDYIDLSPFTDRFTVITSSPRGFATSSRLDAGTPYRVVDLADDLVAVVEAVGFDRFAVFGYSFTGAFAPWLAQLTGRADAVVSGGFPIAGDYAFLYPEIERQSEAAKSDPAAWARVEAAFDNRAALTFYRELSDLPADSLIADLPCPLFAFWGDQDEEMGPGGREQLAAALDRYGLHHISFSGYDHDEMLNHLDDAVPDVLAWLDQL